MSTNQSSIFSDMHMLIEVISLCFYSKVKHTDKKSLLSALQTQRKHVYIFLFLVLFSFFVILPLNIFVIAWTILKWCLATFYNGCEAAIASATTKNIT